MEQKAATKQKSKILKYLPRATSSVSFQNPPLYSPAKEKRSSEKTHKSNLGIGFSGPLVSMIPADNRRKIKNNDSTYALVYEPTSPRVSCMGQVKCKHYRKKLAAAAAANKLPPTTTKVSRTTSFTTVGTHIKEHDQEKSAKVVEPVVVNKSKKKSGIRGLFRGGSVNGGRKSDATNNKSKTELNYVQKAPCLSTMKRFSSGRDAFSNFDWTTQVAPLDSGHRNYFTDDERCGGSDGDDEIKIPSSAPVMERTKGVCDGFVRVGGVNLEPRKEINLWKRRTMAQPKPLQLQTV
ncbi:hypothetical protein L6452_13886 [Arctium lappa]|uniref:Uncharacterized protein n=1 Tax=Arctium lappa TaxID=4217 RepID=A0ACB9CJS5_ARCLA|nr:hypothetical protein L6452_13886 [Arctium lappa]